MQLGMVGLGRMGANLVRRLMRDGHDCVVYDVSADVVSQLEGEGAAGSGSLEQFVSKLDKPRAAWVMVPAAITGDTVNQLADLMDDGDIIIDGGNSYYRDDIDRAKELEAKGVHYVDVGTSGGVFGLERGFCLMIGGEDDVVEHLDPIFKTIAPGLDSAPRTPGKEGEPSPAENGYLHCGPHGAGHFVKMIHNGIEYGLMQAYAEGFDILRHAGAPELPAEQRYDLDLAAIAELWRRGSVVSSWLLDLAAGELAKDPRLDGFSGHVPDSGEGRWTVQAALEEAVPADVLAAALFARFRSRDETAFAGKLLSALRHAFGGHAEAPAPAPGRAP
ncbi:MAG: phosphogluconate dehydrogenase (NAD(+)-dependent, decarboxylating) [Solirubrobacteraceae bacterium]